MFYKSPFLWKIIINYRELRKLWNHLRWFHNFEVFTATLCYPWTKPFFPMFLVYNSWPLPATVLMWVWDAEAPQLSIVVPLIGFLSHVRITYLSYTTTFPLCCIAHIRSRSTWLHVVKRVPCHVLGTGMSHVMDGCAVSRGLYFTLSNPEPQPSWLAMDVAVSLVHAS
jgi:hypothetical protein